MEMGNGIIKTELIHVTKGCRRVLKDTLAVCRDAVSYLNHVACDNHTVILPLSSNEQTPAMEKLVHHTKDNPNPIYKDFDTIFYKMPSYVRRACIRQAVGNVQSHETRCDEYYEKRELEIARKHHYTKMEPAFNFTPNSFQTLYKKETFQLDGNMDSYLCRRNGRFCHSSP